MLKNINFSDKLFIKFDFLNDKKISTYEYKIITRKFRTYICKTCHISSVGDVFF